MAERPINYSVPLSVTNVTSADLVVSNGNIETGGGVDVVIGTIEGDTEAEFCDPDRGIQSVKGSSPSGDLRVDPSGNIYVDGHGDVTLEGPYREVSSVGGYDGEDGDIKVDGNGDLYTEYQTTTTETSANENSTTHSEAFFIGHDSVKSNTSGGELSTGDNDGRLYEADYPSVANWYKWLGHEVVFEVTANTGNSGWIKMELDYTMYSFDADNTVTTPQLDPGESWQWTDTVGSEHENETVGITDATVIDSESGDSARSYSIPRASNYYYSTSDDGRAVDSVSYPSVPSGYSFDHHECFIDSHNWDVLPSSPFDDGNETVTYYLRNGFGASNSYNESGTGGSSNNRRYGPESTTQASGETVDIFIETDNPPGADWNESTYGARTVGTKQVTETKTSSITLFD